MTRYTKTENPISPQYIFFHKQLLSISIDMHCSIHVAFSQEQKTNGDIILSLTECLLYFDNLLQDFRTIFSF